MEEMVDMNPYYPSQCLSSLESTRRPTTMHRPFARIATASSQTVCRLDGLLDLGLGLSHFR